MITRRGFLRFIGGSVLSVAAFSAYAAGIEPMLLTHVKRYALTPPHWPDGLKLHIVALADIHACRPWMTPERIASLVEDANALQPDVIVLLGDYIAGMPLVTGPVTPSQWASALSDLKAPLGVLSILGNHDWWADGFAQRAGAGPTVARKALEKVGIPVLENDVVRLEKDGHGVWIAGLADQLALLPTRDRAGFTGLDDLDGTLAKVSDTSPIILLAHEPDIFPKVPWRVSLTLSGHTHGGQIRLFGYSPVVPSRFGNRYAYGHVVENDRNLIVSGGLGFSILPVRFGMRPEILSIDLG
ncbi:metallophosphoesterase [Mesorhizobium sp. M7A.F.Ca.CA.001.09.2.1]|uniref:Metallophosphoesterase n=1 Tax=Mesorhizobium ciceri TaxID=39645 RepID=A0AB38TFQ5_9HYPH|nr:MULTISPECIES: metallophosphoesterase [Mesorhizobium]RUY36071.1 metallophosphoesterase [Mesorhizobium sp. M7A.F.Ca.CA.001.13.2.1]MDF3214602.1 metallophosphoesterase [Mesorhizobium ciceri]RUY61627.1 metallophosphoesterase [Mesorhizobium sp. M7A.F.Ca.CA.001.13.1.1]RUY66661.1 metallophosphoesterase [Mesorhizobium sp. M7A.F.Ca.CA.001.05.1.1]RUY79638.1 metallophosphoesterase [Mesorhizobium sp. M7A.F.Ca.CA.001.09.2.1]